MDSSRIGRRIAFWRQRRGFTQTEFGRLMGQTKRWVQDLEGGKRQQDPRLSVLVRAAEVLRIPLEQLLSDRPSGPTAGSTPPTGAVGVVDALYESPDSTDPPTLTVLRQRLFYCCEAFQACHYSALARELPALVVGASKAARNAPVHQYSEAQAVLSRVYQLVTSYLHKYGEATAIPAALAADRALAAAERSGDPVQIGAASRRVAKSLVYQQRPETAVEFATSAARRLADGLADRGTLGLSTLGMLHLSAALAASSQERTTDRVRAAVGFVDEADDVADRQGSELNEDWTMFGPTNVGLHRVDVLIRFEDGWSALEAADDLDRASLAAMTRERRAGYHIAVARASLLTRRRADAVEELLKADKLAPEEIEGRPDAVNLVKDVVGATPDPGGQLRALARRCGLPA
ncbi:helix-turn-helix domain-containing protein [Streptomyces flavofungini]|uniref:Helix-turn-helix transcriptional regulator n=1 Tax=Streptomyces flavofungini TaxID=68200 RepID=A0ABS0WXY7_9ACTN|nr:helix-turn-helix transcriptional regulator [Streptomyces flavofungini]MBJ3805798.1 helix-turn-helix transcriptional regulator [Streptomyces flavofungini]GHC71687.1 transcriptional regulator [Streptomyces flavofungini]